VSSLLEKYALFARTECAVTEEALARHDRDLPFVFIDGERHRRVGRFEKTYLSAAGPVTVRRTLYRTQRDAPAVAALSSAGWASSRGTGAPRGVARVASDPARRRGGAGHARSDAAVEEPPRPPTQSALGALGGTP